MAELCPSGELLISSLSYFVDKKEPDLVTGTVTLRLHSRALEYLASRLQSLEELDRLKRSSPLDFLRGAFTDLEDYRRLQKLRQVLSQTRRLCVLPTVCHLRDPTRVNLLPFSSLVSLELRGCDLSTSAWLGLANVQRTIQSITCIGCLEELRHLCSPTSRLLSFTGSRISHPWPQLVSLYCKQNSFEDMDSSLQLLPKLQILDLSSNNISTIQNLHACSMLTELNLSYNSIQSLGPLRECSNTLQRLILQGNAIRNLSGLQGLASLTDLDLRCNLLASYNEIGRLTHMGQLKSLYLEGNPLAYAPFYRLDVLAWFEGSQVELDGQRPRQSEESAVAMRAAGDVPHAWHIMAQYIAQKQLLWRPMQISKPKSGNLWRAASIGPTSPLGSSPSRQTAAHLHRRIPARRIVEFSEDPSAALDSALDKPPSPSPFEGPKEDITDSSSRASSVSGARLSTFRSAGRINPGATQTVYRPRNSKSAQSVQQIQAGSALPTTIRSVLQELLPPLQSGQQQDDESDESSSLATSLSSRVLSPPQSPPQRSSDEPRALPAQTSDEASVLNAPGNGWEVVEP